MRITTNYMYRVSSEAILNCYDKVAKCRNELINGVKIEQAGDNPIDMSHITSLQSKIDNLSHEEERTRDVQQALDYQHIKLTSYKNILTRIKQIIIKASNATSSKLRQKNAAKEIYQYMDSIAAIANLQTAHGKSVFAGERTDIPAWEFTRNAGTIIKAEYQGNQNHLNVLLSSNATVNIYQRGDLLFSPGKQSIFSFLDELAARLNKGIALSGEESTKNLQAIQAFEKSSLVAINEVAEGSKRCVFEKSLHTAVKSNLKKTLVEMREANYPDVIARITRTMNSLKSIMYLSMQIQKLSIFKAE